MPPIAPQFAYTLVTPEERAKAKRERHRRWTASLSDRDWERLRPLARLAAAGQHPARLDDLDAPGIAVGVCPPGWEDRSSGERIGTLKVGDVQIPVLVWDITAGR